MADELKTYEVERREIFIGTYWVRSASAIDAERMLHHTAVDNVRVVLLHRRAASSEDLEAGRVTRLGLVTLTPLEARVAAYALRRFVSDYSGKPSLNQPTPSRFDVAAVAELLRRNF